MSAFILPLYKGECSASRRSEGVGTDEGKGVEVRIDPSASGTLPARFAGASTRRAGRQELDIKYYLKIKNYQSHY